MMKNKEHVDDILLALGKRHFGIEDLTMATSLNLNEESKFWYEFEVLFNNESWKESDFFDTWEFENLWDVKNFIVCRLW